MDLVFSGDNTKQATISKATTGELVYEFTTSTIKKGGWTSNSITETTVQKLDVLKPEIVGSMKLHAGQNVKKEECICHGHDVLPRIGGWFKAYASCTHSRCLVTFNLLQIQEF